MRSRLTPISILQLARVVFAEPLPGAYSVINQDIEFITTLFEADAQGILPKLKEAPEVTANRLRGNLMRELLLVPHPSPHYNAIHNALLLLGHYFPYSLEDEATNITCCITLNSINENEIRFVLASGHHISITGADSIVTHNVNFHPVERKPMPERDWLRMRLLYEQRNLRMETNVCEYAAGGALYGFTLIAMPVMGVGCIVFVIIFVMTILGIIHFPVFLSIAMQSTDMVRNVGLGIEFIPSILGAVIGALVGLIPAPAKESVATIESLKEQIGDVLENSAFKKLNYHLEPNVKENKRIIAEEKADSVVLYPKKISQDDLILPCQTNSSVSLRTSRSCPNFFKDSKSDTAASFASHARALKMPK